MLEQRRRFLDKREAALRGADTHLLELKSELEQIVTRHEKLVEAERKRAQATLAKTSTEADKSKDPGIPVRAMSIKRNWQKSMRPCLRKKPRRVWRGCLNGKRWRYFGSLRANPRAPSSLKSNQTARLV